MTREQIESAERLANEIILENRPVDIRFVTRDEAGKLGLRKLPPAERDELRLIDIRDGFAACAAARVAQRQAGLPASWCVKPKKFGRDGAPGRCAGTARCHHCAARFHHAYGNCRAVFCPHLRCTATSSQGAGRDQIAAQAIRTVAGGTGCGLCSLVLLAEAASETHGRRIVVRTLTDREMNFVKLLAQKLTRLSPGVVALLATTSPQPSLVFAQSTGQPFDMGALMKETMTKLGGRGGGSKDLAQGGIPNAERIEATLKGIAATLAAESAA